MEDSERVGAQIQDYVHSSGQKRRQRDVQLSCKAKNASALKDFDDDWGTNPLRGSPNALKISALQGYGGKAWTDQPLGLSIWTTLR